jgi:hypothetical protein
MSMNFALHLALVAFLGLALPSLPARAQGSASDRQSRAQLEEQARARDQRIIELQHERMAARHDGDQATMERAQKDLKEVQQQRVETLRALGQLP